MNNKIKKGSLKIQLKGLHLYFRIATPGELVPFCPTNPSPKDQKLEVQD